VLDYGQLLTLATSCTYPAPSANVDAIGAMFVLVLVAAVCDNGSVLVIVPAVAVAVAVAVAADVSFVLLQPNPIPRKWPLDFGFMDLP